MTLKDKFQQWFINDEEDEHYEGMVELVSIEHEKIADEFAIGFAEWKNGNFSMYRDKTYYANTSSKHFDITKYVGKEKSTKYFTLQELLEIYKKEKGL